MLSKYKIGLNAENFVINLLRKNGFEILHHRYKTQYGEIDVIAKKNAKVHFLEVKLRNNFENFYIEERQLNRIKNTMDYFSSEHESHKEISFGVMLVNRKNNYKYINNAYLD